ncbi:SRPBCC family protein [Nakamurella lactea]|uniref:SRPBCC family protein n=1 Tax=Nakamurella lactea TaxID=459515 RepID=UPI0003F66C21|nr:SRPBCC domain-containing protein [Nakamurella lactea]
MNPIQLTMTRTFNATAEQLWRAWTTEDGLATWWWHTWPDTRYQVDATVGGSYRIDAADHGIGVRGVFLELTPPQRLVFSWIWIEDGAEGESERVAVTFTPDGDGTRIDLLHTGPWTSAEPVDAYRQGWDFVLDALEHTTDSVM